MLNHHLSGQKPGPECAWFADLLPLLGEGALPEPEASETRAHLATCASCRQEYAAYQRIEANLRRHFGALPELRFSPEDLLMLSDDTTPAEPAPETAPAPPETQRPRRRRVVSLFSLVAAALVVVVVVTALVVSRALPNTATTHHVVGSPTPTPLPELPYRPGQYGYLDAIQMLSSTEGWAVGTAINPNTLQAGVSPLILHYHDGQWRRVAAPSFGQTNLTGAALYSISMVSADEGWAVGYGPDFQGISNSVILHYKGGRWSIYGSPMFEASFNQVDMLSPTDGWMVGESNISVPGQQASMILHYNGIRWTPVQAPSVHAIYSLDMLSATNGWAVAPGQGTILHYDGQQWSIFQQVSQIDALSMDSASDGWAVGYSPTLSAGTLFWHYNGQRWVQSWTLTSGKAHISANALALSMDSATDGWAMGYEGPVNSSGNTATPLYLHYAHGQWTKAQGPQGVFVDTITMLSANEGWAAGQGGVMLHYLNGIWSQYHFS
jgi:hypothetical protein